MASSISPSEIQKRSCNVALTGDRAEGTGGEKREGRARRTWRRVSGLSHAPPEPDAIHCTVELVQSRKTGVIEDEEPKSATAGPAEKEFDIFTGDTSGQFPLAKIKTHASTWVKNTEPGKKSGLWGLGKGKPHPRKSVIPESPT